MSDIKKEEEEEQTLVRTPIQPQKTKQEQPQKDKQLKNKPDQSSLAQSLSQDSLLKNKVDLADSLNQDQLKEEEEQEIQEQVYKIPDDYFYPENHVEKIHIQSPIPQMVIKMDNFIGHDSFKKYNVFALDRDTIIYSSGISYTLYNHFTKEKKLFFSKDKGGIGSIAVHPNKQYFAIAQKGIFPCIYIYQYPSLKLYRILRKGTQKSYSCICFSGKGTTLASVGSDPDYLLTVWQWKQQKELLKSKAFSQEVYRVSFSQFNQYWLTTSGTGHIRFWKISQTFTGLKLQGDIAKFGQFELSDITSYTQFEDGNVLSSSQYGKLLLWQGNLIKSIISINQQTNCHKGSIQYVKLLHNNNKIITSGSDGYIKIWDYYKINQTQSDQYFNVYIEPEKQIYFQSCITNLSSYIIWIEIYQQFWFVQDSLGTLWKYQLQTNNRNIILNYPAGKFTDFIISPLNNSCITTGYDGFVRLFDYGNKNQFYSRKFNNLSQSICADWFPFSKRNNGRMIAVGFSDGIVRFLGLKQNNFYLIKAIKVHKNSIHKIKINSQGTIIVVIDIYGSIFLISIDTFNINKIQPYCLFQTNFKINDICWDKNNQKILLACQDGKLHQIYIPKENQCNYTQTYLKQFKKNTFIIKMMQSQKPNRQDLQLELLLKKTKGTVVDDVIVDQQWQPSPIMNATYYDNQCTKVLCSVQGKYLGKYYIIDFKKQRPIASIQSSKYKTSYLHYSPIHDLIFIGFKNGFWQLRHRMNPSNYLRMHCYDQNYGIVRRIEMNVDNTALISNSQDGTMMIHKFDFSSFLKGTKGQSIEQIQLSIPGVMLGISEITFADKVDFGDKEEYQDILDNSIYCLQDQKLKAQQDIKLSEADKIKKLKYTKIAELRKLFEQTVENNEKETDYLAKLTKEQLIVDKQYVIQFQQRINQQQSQTYKQLQWNEYYSSVITKKLQQHFINILEYDKFYVKGIINQNLIISSFKILKLTKWIQEQLNKIQQIIAHEINSSNNNNDKKQIHSYIIPNNKNIQYIKNKDKKKQLNIQVKNKIKQAQIEFQKQLAQAIATKGDYKLKCATNYIVPENQRLNVSRKKKHLFLHYQYLFMEKKQFNKRLLTLRNKKQTMIDNLIKTNHRLRQINKELDIFEDDIVLEIDEQIEIMQSTINVSEQEIAEHIIKKQRQKQASKKTGGMGMSSGDAIEKNKEDKKDQQNKKKKKNINYKKSQKSIKPQSSNKARNSSKLKKLSVLEIEMKEIKKIQLENEKKQIMQSFQQEVRLFDQELINLKSIKYHLQNDLCLVQMKILTYFQEFIIFRDMQKQDNKLMSSLTTFSQQKQQLQNTFNELNNEIEQLQIINEEIKKKFEEQKKILKQFVYPDNDEMRQKIIRHFKNKERNRINKLKKQAQEEQKAKESHKDNDDDSDENEQDDQDIDQDEEDQEDQFQQEDQKPDTTIIENDHKNFQRVRKICEYDQKIQQNTRKKKIQVTKKNETINKIKNITNQLKNVDNELKVYQKKKLLKINQLLVSLPIKLSQIEYIIKINDKNNKLQDDFTNCILFTSTSFNRLGQRIQQLKNQKIDIQKKQKNLNKKLTKLLQQVNKYSIEIENKRKDYQQKQLLKFGSTFEIEKLKQLQPNQQVLNMRNLYKKQQRDISRKIQQTKKQLQQKKRQLLETKRQNTKVITEITELGDRQNELKKKLDKTNKQLFKNDDATKKDDLEKQRQNLKDLIKFLEKEIQDLKTEIGLFKRKGGHIYTMVTSNKKNFS